MYLTGVYTALITPFKREAVDVDGLTKLAKRQVAGGVDGVLALGVTAETPTLSFEEQEIVLQTILNECQGKITVIAGTGGNCTKSTIERSQWAQELGADALLVITPYLNRPTQRGIFHHFEAVCNAVDIPVIVYNSPGRTGVNIEPLTLREIAELPNIAGVKESSGDIAQTGEILHYVDHNDRPFAVFSADDAEILPMMALGGRGVFSVLGNLIPEQIVQLFDAIEQGDLNQARKIHYELLPLFKASFLETNPMPIKEMMNLCGLPAGPCRSPLCAMSEPHRNALHRIVQELGLVPART
jgi:4-hydroxy-tetrahydrodipicolinate synthase